MIVKVFIIIGIALANFLAYLKVRDMFFTNKIAKEEKQQASNNAAISQQSGIIEEDTKELEDALNNYNNLKSGNNSGNSNKPS
jgi:hypothetical protein